jgi:glycosyltransferase involved in cell wall biosynthesis
MRILKTTQTYYPYLRMGGPPVKVRGIARALASRGHKVTVLTACLDDADADAPLNVPTSMSRSGSWITHDRGVEAIYLPTIASYRATTINPRVINFCRARLNEFDVVHIYGLYDLLGSAVAWFCRRRGIPYVLEPLGMFGAKIRSHRKKQLYEQVFGNSLFRGAAKVIATSEKERQELIDGGVALDTVLLRRNGLDLNEFQELPERGRFRARLRLNEGTPLILFVGRLSFIKGLDLLVEAFARLNGDAVLVLAGPDDDDGCEKRIWKLVKELRLEGRVIRSAAVYGPDKLQALVDADIFVLPSRYESFGNAAAEALACGTPVLVTSDCGIAPLVESRGGLVVPCDVQSLADGMTQLLNDQQLRLELGRGATDVAKSLSWDEPVEAMENLYSRVTHLQKSAIAS